VFTRVRHLFRGVNQVIRCDWNRRAFKMKFTILSSTLRLTVGFLRFPTKIVSVSILYILSKCYSNGKCVRHFFYTICQLFNSLSLTEQVSECPKKFLFISWVASHVYTGSFISGSFWVSQIGQWEGAMCGMNFKGKVLDKISCVVDNSDMPQ
jgi:hypothetical protein